MYGGWLIMAYATRSQGTTGGLDIFRILGIVGIFIIAAPWVLLGALELLVWRGLQRIYPLGKHWAVALFVLSFLPLILATRTAARDPLAENPLLGYYDAQSIGAVENVARLRGAQIEDAGFADYLGRTLPVTLPGSIGAAFVLGWLLRKKWSPLQRRDAVGVDVPRRVEKKLARGMKHPAGGWAIGMTAEGQPVAVDDAHARQHVLICGATGSGKTTVIRHLLDGVAHRCPVVLHGAEGHRYPCARLAAG